MEIPEFPELLGVPPVPPDGSELAPFFLFFGLGLEVAPVPAPEPVSFDGVISSVKSALLGELMVASASNAAHLSRLGAILRVIALFINDPWVLCAPAQALR